MNLNVPYSSAYDEGVYLSSARLVMEGHTLFSSVFSAQPPAFLEILALAFRLFGDTVACGRAVMVFFSLISLGTVAWISWRVAGPLASPLAIVSLGLPFLFFEMARSVEAENPALTFALLAVALVLPGTEQHSWKRLIAGGVVFALGMLCKLLVAPMILPILFLLTLEPVSNRTMAWRFSTARPVFVSSIMRRCLIFTVASITTCLLAFSAYDYFAAYDQVVRFHMEAKAYFGTDTLSNLRLIYDQVLSTELGIVFLAIAGLIILFARNRLAAAWISLWVFATSLFLLDHSPLFDHHLILLLPPLAIAAAASILWIPAFWHRSWGKLLPLFLLFPLICYDSTSGLEWTVERDLAVSLNSHEPRQVQRVVYLIQKYTHPDDLVVDDQPMHVFAAERQSPPMLADTSYVRIESGYLTADQAINFSRDAQMVVFWTDRLALLPEYRRWVQTHFQLIKRFGEKHGKTKEIYLRESPPYSEDQKP
jgi:4-amino-4-deoxy-L-arabinose transferase-like glycosyltransferase